MDFLKKKIIGKYDEDLDVDTKDVMVVVIDLAVVCTGCILDVQGLIVKGRANLMRIGDTFRVADVVDEGRGGIIDFVVGELDTRHNAFAVG